MTFRPGILTHRYIRVKIRKTVGDAPSVIAPPEHKLPPPELQHPPEFKPTRIFAGGSVIRFPPVGRCIYCGEPEYITGTGEPPHEEHIVPEGMGGTLVLPQASCKDCADKVNRAEGKVLRTTFLAPRHKLRLRMKKRKRADAYPMTTEIDGKDVEIVVPLDEHITLLLLLALRAPRILLPRPDDEHDYAGVFVHAFDNINQPVASPSVDLLRFSQMLAKIAHGFAVATCGLHGFRPLLPDWIRRDFEPLEFDRRIFDYVGGLPSMFGRGDELHALDFAVTEHNGIYYLVVFIRLFSNLGAPVYQVVVGTFDEVLLQADGAIGVTHGHSRDKTPAGVGTDHPIPDPQDQAVP